VEIIGTVTGAIAALFAIVLIGAWIIGILEGGK
jgi:hypothetical protein